MAVQPPSAEGGAGEPISRYPVAARPLLAQIAAKHAPTYNHMGRVSGLVESFATYLRLSRKEVRMASLSALLHDIGKLEIPGAILTKTGWLTAPEIEVVCRHAEYGAEILARNPALSEHAEAVRHHHEWFDGRGYPDGLSGDRIPWVSRLISICDAFDSMTTPRPYAPPLSLQQALAEIERGAGTQFDPDLARQFAERYRKGRIARVVSRTKAADSEERPQPLAVRR